MGATEVPAPSTRPASVKVKDRTAGAACKAPETPVQNARWRPRQTPMNRFSVERENAWMGVSCQKRNMNIRARQSCAIITPAPAPSPATPPSCCRRG
jgi:hypothetical protein